MSTDANPAPAIKIAGLTKDFPLARRGLKLRAVENLDLQINTNEVFGLLGPNGSGKSTTIKVILGLLEPTAGTCEVFGRPSREVNSRQDVGYLPESPYFYRYLSGRELVTFYARICGVERSRLRARVDEVIEWVGLQEASRRRVGTYSKGMLQRIGLAQALVHDPRLIILDEPTAGVDPVGSAEIAALILGLKKRGKTILLSSHLLAQVEGICDRIAILDRGRLILAGHVDELVGERGRDALIVEGFPRAAEPELRAWLEARGARLTAIEQPRTTLDRVFLEHVGRTRTDAGENKSTGDARGKSAPAEDAT
jgi:ABC-2 type transport system ATP-binding protein